ncbi:hypothetical protein GCM10011579_035320 [Streptomyces albiflavescens]|uniref:Uncharacterized protein n=1 Tax=Streptomyces albiflavescens TaxID=1623582 RepID=A0A917Y2N1_9ACTN|nr:hypothetical protein GCM10011579_035320 [Streptomyces albiflavescens]
MRRDRQSHTPPHEPPRQDDKAAQGDRAVLTGCQDFVSAQARHALLRADAPSLGLTTICHTLPEQTVNSRTCRGCSHIPHADTDIVERRAGRIARGIGFAAERTIDLTGAVCAACHPSRNQGDLPCTWNRAQESPGPARTSAN